jgi:hypothetical protein
VDNTLGFCGLRKIIILPIQVIEKQFELRRSDLVCSRKLQNNLDVFFDKERGQAHLPNLKIYQT